MHSTTPAVATDLTFPLHSYESERKRDDRVETVVSTGGAETAMSACGPDIAMSIGGPEIYMGIGGPETFVSASGPEQLWALVVQRQP